MVPQVPAPPDPEPERSVETPPVIAAVSQWLSARWLPSPVPWEPDPAWLDDDEPLPEPAMPPQALATIFRLVDTRTALVQAVGLDLLVPAQRTRLARVVSTLNKRMPLLAPLAEDWRPWSALAMLNDQVDTIRSALATGLFEPAQAESDAELAASPQSPSNPVHRSLLAQVMRLLPVVSIVSTLNLDPDDPAQALDQLARVVRELRTAPLPPLADPLLVMRLIARNNAVARLQNSVGTLPYEEVCRRVAEKVEDVLEELPPDMPPLLPNPAQIINAPTVAAAKRLTQAFVDGLNWNVPPEFDPPLLTVGAPVAALVTGMAAMAPTRRSPVRTTPCDQQCDAARVAAAS